VKQIYCPDCDSFEPLYEEPPHADRDGFAYFDLVCTRCRFLIATIRIAAVQPPNGVHDPHGLASAGRRN
jgi:hypothetical protein